MTNEEHIKKLTDILAETTETENAVCYVTSEDKETLEAAISALSQPQGCNGCKYEATGNNSTYPCSHCGRCYTDKYKAESEDKE